MDINMALTLIGGLALFLYGMNVMGGGLEKLAGGRLEQILEKLTANPIKAVLLGAGVTAAVQSSAATTVMLIGFVNAGIMRLHQAVGVIMGANIGTTITAWILSLSGLDGDSFLINMLKPTSFSPVFAIVGIILIMAGKTDRKKTLGSIFIGFAILMFGMNMMSGAVEPLSDSEKFRDMLTLFTNPLLGVFAGALITTIMQSSSVSVGILQAVSSTGALNFSAALPIILGQNIGSCTTAMISSVGTSKNAKRVAVVHLCFNIIGTVLFLSGFYILNALFDFTFMDGPINETMIAIVHTIFNLSVTAVLLPFTKLLEKLAYLLVKEEKNKEEKINPEDQFRLLDDRFLQSPAFAIEHCRSVAAQMADISRASIHAALKITNKYSDDLLQEINDMEDMVDMYEDRLGTYLVKLSSTDLTFRDSQSVATLLHNIGDFERISDHAKNIAQTAKERHDKHIHFSERASEEINVVGDAVKEILDLAVKAATEQDLYSAYLVEPLEEVVDQLRTKLKSRHVKRLQKGMCTIELGFIFTDLLTNLERVSDHCSNIAVCLIQVNDDNFETHEYIRTVKTSGEAFDSEVARYLQKYKLPAKDF